MVQLLDKSPWIVNVNCINDWCDICFQSTDEFRSRFHVDAFVFSASSLEDVFLFLASTRLVTASKVAPLQDRAPARTAPKATTVSLVRHESFRVRQSVVFLFIC